jgi:integrase
MIRFQDPKIVVRKGKRDYYVIRPYVARPGSAGLQRKQKPIRLGYVDEKLSARKLQERKQEVMAPINRGTLILQAQIPFAELVEKYRDARLPKLSAAARERYESHLANHILPVFGKAKLADIDRQSIEAWLIREGQPHTHRQARDGRGVKPRRDTPVTAGSNPAPWPEEVEYAGLGWWSLWSLRGVMSAIFSAAEEWGLWHGKNPCSRIKLGQKTEKREKRIPNAADLQKFLAALPNTKYLGVDSARLVVLTAVAAGLRVSEVLGLQVTDVDTSAGTLKVERTWRRGEVGPLKSAASRRIRQVGALARQLVELGRGHKFIFEQKPGSPPDDRDLQRYVIRPAAEAVGIYAEGFGMHAFRRLNISWRQEAGATPFEAMKAAGHSKPDVTWLYTITDAEREKAHVDAILERVLPAGGVKQ